MRDGGLLVLVSLGSSSVRVSGHQWFLAEVVGSWKKLVPSSVPSRIFSNRISGGASWVRPT